MLMQRFCSRRPGFAPRRRVGVSAGLRLVTHTIVDDDFAILSSSAGGPDVRPASGGAGCFDVHAAIRNLGKLFIGGRLFIEGLPEQCSRALMTQLLGVSAHCSISGHLIMFHALA